MYYFLLTSLLFAMAGTSLSWVLYQLVLARKQVKPSFDPEKRINARWCWDSETGEKCLVDLDTSEILIRGK